MPDDECVGLLTRIRSHAVPKARVFIIENIIGLQKQRPDFAVIFDLFLLLGGRRSRVRTEPEFRSLLEDSGLECLGVRQILNSQCVVEAQFT